MTPLRKVAALPFDVRPGEVAHNLECVLAAIARCRDAGVGLLCLPEKWTTSFLPSYAPADVAASEEALAEAHRAAEAAGLCLVGSAPAGAGPGGKPYNEVHFLGVGGLRRPYRKRVLFSPTGEGRQVARGDGLPVTLDTPVGPACALVCYDLRFPELTRYAFHQRAELLVVPAQWPHPRTAIWELLARARAAENQQWLLSCNRAGTAGLDGMRPMDFPGTALLVDPLGEVAARVDDGGLLVAEIDVEQAAEVRRRVPCARDLVKAGLGPDDQSLPLG